MGDRQHGQRVLAAAQLVEQVEHPLGGAAVERGGDLVGQQQSRTARQSSGQRDPLPLPAGQRSRVAVSQLRRKTHRAEQAFGFGDGLDTTEPAQRTERAADRGRDRAGGVECRQRILADQG